MIPRHDKIADIERFHGTRATRGRYQCFGRETDDMIGLKLSHFFKGKLVTHRFGLGLELVEKLI